MNKYSQLESVPKGVEPIQEPSKKNDVSSLPTSSDDSPAEVKEVDEYKSSKSKKDSGIGGHTRPLQSSVIRKNSTWN